MLLEDMSAPQHFWGQNFGDINAILTTFQTQDISVTFTFSTNKSSGGIGREGNTPGRATLYQAIISLGGQQECRVTCDGVCGRYRVLTSIEGSCVSKVWLCYSYRFSDGDGVLLE